MPRSVIVALAPGNAMPWSVVQMTSVLSREARSSSSASQHRADAAVERARAGVEGGHVAARLGRVGQVRRRARRSARRRRSGSKNSRCVSKNPTDRKNGSAGGVAQQVDRRPARRRRRGVVSILTTLVVADHVRALRDVLLADQRRVVAGVAQRVDDVVAVVVQRPAAVREAEHAVGVGVLAGEQAGAAGRAGRRGAERLAEQHALARRGPGCAASGSRGRTAGRSGRCRASAGRGCSAVSRRRL